LIGPVLLDVGAARLVGAARMNDEAAGPIPKLSLMQGGASYRIFHRALGMQISESRAVGRIAIILALVTWAPLLALSATQSLERGGSGVESFLRDFTPHVSFLFALPLLIIADIIVGPRFIKIGDFLCTSGLLEESQVLEFRSLIVTALKFRDATITESTILMLAYLVTALEIHFRTGVSSWLTSGANQNAQLTLAGWWCALVSLPVIQFFLYRWIFRLSSWVRVMYGVSRLDLQLTPTHPDRAGGLGFIGETIPAAALIVLAISAIWCSRIATQVVHGELTLEQFTISYGVFVAIITVAFVGPFFLFTPKLVRLKRTALMEYRTLGIRWGQLFEKKWVGAASTEVSISSAEVSALVGFERTYAGIQKIKLVPLELANLKAIVVAALLPVVPFVGTQIPIENVLKLLKKIIL
jgi:hypothetical protein